MLRRAFAFTLAMLLCLCGSATSEELGKTNGGGVNFTSSPLGIYDVAGKQLFALGSLRGEVEAVIGATNTGYRLVLDADEIVLPVPVEPTPTGTVAYEEAVEALIAAAPSTSEEVDEVLSPFGLGASDLSEITGGLFTKSDVEWGRITADRWETLAKVHASNEETYALQLKTYELQKGTPYDQWLEEVRSSLTITRGMLSLMVLDGEYIGDPRCSLWYTAVPEVEELIASLDLPEGYDFGLYFCMSSMLEGRSFASLEERNDCIKETYEELTGKFKELNDLAGKVYSVTMYSFGYFTAEGEYVGMPVDANKLSELGIERSYRRYYSGSTESPVELSAEYIQSLETDELRCISPLYCIEVDVDLSGYINRIKIQTFWE